jgi:patatin-related protein
MTVLPPSVRANTGTALDELALAYTPEREIRIAVVMYGGVSLAIYMYGVAQELLNLVKATAPAVPGNSERGALAFPDDDSTVVVYRKLARVLGGADGHSGPVRVRFVIDLISGSSAGGLNGVCLASALANDRPGRDTRLEPLEDLWVRNGELETLFAGPDSERAADGTPDPDLKLPEAPPSLLNGLRFYKLLAETLHNQLSEESGGVDSLQSRLVDQLDLWVTATDLDGRQVTIPIKNATVSERQHAYRFHFAYDPVQQRNDFTRDVAPFVAFAGRSTSSFPVAFEPMRLERIVAFPLSPAWQARFYPEFDPGTFERIPFSDGGILDNKPFSYATQNLLRRPATLLVDRYLLYVEPDPKPADPAPVSREWNALESALAALTGIPRSETIRGDLEFVRHRNRAIRRARALLFRSGLTPSEQQRNALIAPRIERHRWLSMGFAEMVASESQFGPTYPVYHRLKVSAVCDFLANLLTRALDLDPDGEEAPKSRVIVDAWKASRYQEEPEPRPQGQMYPRTETEFLFRFDLPFRIRRLSYVLSRLRDLSSGDESRISNFFRASGATTTPSFDPDEVMEIRRALSGALIRLVEMEERLAGPGGALREALAKAGVDSDSITAMKGEEEGALRAQVPSPLTSELSPFDSIVHDEIKDVTEQARDAVEGALGVRHTTEDVENISERGVADLGRAVRFLYDAFEAFDLVYLPLSYETAVAETNPVTIIRVSPLDAKNPEGVSRQLRGIALNHFAAFTDSTWRQHDIAWGRLNASEILIRELLPDGHPESDALVNEAHALIAQHYAATATPLPDRTTTSTDADGLPVFADVPITDKPHWSSSLRRAARIASVTARDQLRRRKQETAARAVQLATEAADDASAFTLATGLIDLLPARVRKALIATVGALALLALFCALVAIPTDGQMDDVLLVVAALDLGVLAGATIFILVSLAVARSWFRGTIDRALERF